MLLTVPKSPSSDADAPLDGSGRVGPDHDRNPETLPMPAAGDSTPTERLAPLPVTVPMPAHVPPRPRTPAADTAAPTEAISSIGPGTKLPPQQRPATTRPKQLAWSNLPNSEPIPLGAVAGGVDVTGTHPTLPPPATPAYTAALAAMGTGAVSTVEATAVTDDVTGQDAAEPDATAADAPKKRRRHRGLIVALSSTAVVLVLIGIAAAIGWQVAETRASSAVKQTVQQKVDKALGLAASHPVAVKFDEPVLPQVWAGKLDTLTFTVAGAPIAGSTGTIRVHATDVPTSGTGDPKTIDATVRLKPNALKAIVSANRTALGQILPESVKVDGSDVTVSLNPAQFLSGISFSEVLRASVEDGKLVLTPKKFVVGGFGMSADTVRARFGGLAQGILATRTICLADTYPSGMTLTGLDVKKDAVVADFDVQPGILSDPALQAKGTCK